MIGKEFGECGSHNVEVVPLSIEYRAGGLVKEDIAIKGTPDEIQRFVDHVNSDHGERLELIESKGGKSFGFKYN